MEKLNDVEKEYLQHFIEKACNGTPLQPNAEFTGGYLGSLIVHIIENFEYIRECLKKDPEGYKNS